MCLVLHTLFFIFFAVQIIPWSMVAFQLLFASSGMLLLASKHIIVMLAFLSKTALYLIEGVFRSTAR